MVLWWKALILNIRLIFYDFHILESEDYEDMRSRNEDTEAIYEVNEWCMHFLYDFNKEGV